MTVTERVWFLRQARATRCSSFAGFHGRSTLAAIVALQEVRRCLAWNRIYQLWLFVDVPTKQLPPSM